MALPAQPEIKPNDDDHIYQTPAKLEHIPAGTQYVLGDRAANYSPSANNSSQVTSANLFGSAAVIDGCPYAAPSRYLLVPLPM